MCKTCDNCGQSLNEEERDYSDDEDILLLCFTCLDDDDHVDLEDYLDTYDYVGRI